MQEMRGREKNSPVLSPWPHMFHLCERKETHERPLDDNDWLLAAIRLSHHNYNSDNDDNLDNYNNYYYNFPTQS